MRDALTKAGHAPLVTGEPQELAHIIRTEKPRLVLLDLILPGGDGIALMESVPVLSDLPVIFISGYGRAETVARALESGSADCIIKPFPPTELVARVRAALRRAATRNRSRSCSASSRSTTIDAGWPSAPASARFSISHD